MVEWELKIRRKEKLMKRKKKGKYGVSMYNLN